MLVVIAISATTESGMVPQSPAALTAIPEKCPSVQKALRFYTKRWQHWTQLRGAGLPQSRAKGWSCPRYLLKIRIRKSAAAKKNYERWYAYHWDWESWLPDKWQRIGACETGYGQRPGRWNWNSGTYQGAFGFYYGTWDQYKPAGAPSEAYRATPRQQYQCALNVAAAHGYQAWGCGNA